MTSSWKVRPLAALAYLATPDPRSPASVTYGSVANTIEYLCDRSEQPRPVAYVVELAFPMTHQQIIDAFRARVRELKQLHSDRKFTYPPGTQGEGNRFVVVIDAITSLPGVVQPWKDLVKICKEEGLWSIVDAAHVLGQQVCGNAAAR